jgi:hypothetical protein
VVEDGGSGDPQSMRDVVEGGAAVAVRSELDHRRSTDCVPCCGSVGAPHHGVLLWQALFKKCRHLGSQVEDFLPLLTTRSGSSD